MVKQASRLSQRFLELIDSTQGMEIFDTLNEIMNLLETKDDPDMTEVCIVGSLSEFSEKFQVVKHNLKSYADGKRTLLGDKLSELYDNNNHEGFYSNSK